jgi:hypothetical protein
VHVVAMLMWEEDHVTSVALLYSNPYMSFEWEEDHACESDALNHHSELYTKNYEHCSGIYDGLI